MKIKNSNVTVFCGSLLILFTLANTVSASTADVIQPARPVGWSAEAVKIGDLGSYIDEYNTYIDTNTDWHFQKSGFFRDVSIGSQGVGGVTYFNGTIINDTDNEGVENPVTFGDDVRIDGGIYRGSSKGTSDGMPLKIYDTMVPGVNNVNDIGSTSLRWQDGFFAGTVTAGGLQGTGIVDSDNIANGTIVTADLADSSVTSAKIADGTIALADIAGDAVVGDHIMNGTITGSDVSSSTTLTLGGVDWDSAKTGYTTVDGSNCSGGNVSYTNGFCQNDGTGATSAYWNVDLPHQATVTAFRGMLYDNHSNDKFTCRLIRRYL
ncbi:MAG: hypothetical protein ABII72_02430, partial [Parcubacteria group bacterium]